MKISTKGRYGLRILLDLALFQEGDNPRMIRDIAKSQELSEKYISRLMIDLRRAGLVKSIRGAGGGYLPTKKPKDITVLEVVEAMEGPISVAECLDDPSCCNRTNLCLTHGLWETLNVEIKETLEKINLQGILDKYQHNCKKPL